MTIKQLAKEIAKREGKRKQVDIAQITEILGALSDMVFEDFNHEGEGHITRTWCCLYDNGAKRAQKRKK